MDRSDLKAEIWRLLGDPQHTRWIGSVLEDRIELAQTEIQALTGAVKTVESLTPTASTAEVTVDDDTIDIIRVTWTDTDGDIAPLDGRTREDLDFYEPNWPNLEPDRPKTWFFDASNRQIVLVPAPASSEISASCLKVWEVRRPQAMTQDTDEPFDGNVLMRAYHMSIVDWVVAQCWKDNADPESLQKSRFYKSNDPNAPGEFEKELHKINAKFDAPTDIPGRILWQPQGGRRGQVGRPSKAYPLA